MNEMIAASFENLIVDDIGTANWYFDAAVKTIDGNFGEGFAKKHPELIGSYLNAASMRGQVSAFSKVFEHCVLRVANSISDIANSMGDC